MIKWRFTRKLKKQKCHLCKIPIDQSDWPVRVTQYRLRQPKMNYIRHEGWFCDKACLMKWTGQNDSTVRQD